ncbi:hypothetical protein HDU96_001111 [Phlyctochytrium bullatum]|nr:hypothetical protein HDU96_001111 [Phlyctochytrium bullatum]
MSARPAGSDGARAGEGGEHGPTGSSAVRVATTTMDPDPNRSFPQDLQSAATGIWQRWTQRHHGRGGPGAEEAGGETRRRRDGRRLNTREIPAGGGTEWITLPIRSTAINPATNSGRSGSPAESPDAPPWLPQLQLPDPVFDLGAPLHGAQASRPVGEAGFAQPPSLLWPFQPHPLHQPLPPQRGPWGPGAEGEESRAEAEAGTVGEKEESGADIAASAMKPYRNQHSDDGSAPFLLDPAAATTTTSSPEEDKAAGRAKDRQDPTAVPSAGLEDPQDADLDRTQPQSSPFPFRIDLGLRSSFPRPDVNNSDDPFQPLALRHPQSPSARCQDRAHHLHDPLLPTTLTQARPTGTGLMEQDDLPSHRAAASNHGHRGDRGDSIWRFSTIAPPPFSFQELGPLSLEAHHSLAWSHDMTPHHQSQVTASTAGTSPAFFRRPNLPPETPQAPYTKAPELSSHHPKQAVERFEPVNTNDNSADGPTGSPASPSGPSTTSSSRVSVPDAAYHFGPVRKETEGTLRDSRGGPAGAGHDEGSLKRDLGPLSTYADTDRPRRRSSSANPPASFPLDSVSAAPCASSGRGTFHRAGLFGLVAAQSLGADQRAGDGLVASVASLVVQDKVQPSSTASSVTPSTSLTGVHHRSTGAAEPNLQSLGEGWSEAQDPHRHNDNPQQQQQERRHRSDIEAHRHGTDHQNDPAKPPPPYPPEPRSITPSASFGQQPRHPDNLPPLTRSPSFSAADAASRRASGPSALTAAAPQSIGTEEQQSSPVTGESPRRRPKHVLVPLRVISREGTDIAAARSAPPLPISFFSPAEDDTPTTSHTHPWPPFNRPASSPPHPTRPIADAVEAWRAEDGGGRYAGEPSTRLRNQQLQQSGTDVVATPLASDRNRTIPLLGHFSPPAPAPSNQAPEISFNPAAPMAPPPTTTPGAAQPLHTAPTPSPSIVSQAPAPTPPPPTTMHLSLFPASHAFPQHPQPFKPVEGPDDTTSSLRIQPPANPSPASFQEFPAALRPDPFFPPAPRVKLEQPPAPVSQPHSGETVAAVAAAASAAAAAAAAMAFATSRLNPPTILPNSSQQQLTPSTPFPVTQPQHPLSRRLSWAHDAQDPNLFPQDGPFHPFAQGGGTGGYQVTPPATASASTPLATSPFSAFLLPSVASQQQQQQSGADTGSPRHQVPQHFPSAAPAPAAPPQLQFQTAPGFQPGPQQYQGVQQDNGSGAYDPPSGYGQIAPAESSDTSLRLHQPVSHAPPLHHRRRRGHSLSALAVNSPRQEAVGGADSATGMAMQSGSPPAPVMLREPGRRSNSLMVVWEDPATVDSRGAVGQAFQSPATQMFVDAMQPASPRFVQQQQGVPRSPRPPMIVPSTPTGDVPPGAFPMPSPSMAAVNPPGSPMVMGHSPAVSQQGMMMIRQGMVPMPVQFPMLHPTQSPSLMPQLFSPYPSSPHPVAQQAFGGMGLQRMFAQPQQGTSMQPSAPPSRAGTVRRYEDDDDDGERTSEPGGASKRARGSEPMEAKGKSHAERQLSSSGAEPGLPDGDSEFGRRRPSRTGPGVFAPAPAAEPERRGSIPPASMVAFGMGGTRVTPGSSSSTPKSASLSTPSTPGTPMVAQLHPALGFMPKSQGFVTNESAGEGTSFGRTVSSSTSTSTSSSSGGQVNMPPAAPGGPGAMAYMTKVIKKVTPEGLTFFECPFPGCGRPFRRRYNLSSHLYCHTGEKPQVCEVCGWGFSRRHDLKRHIKTLHNDDRPFSCSSCHQRFLKEDQLARHRHVCDGGAGSTGPSSEAPLPASFPVTAPATLAPWSDGMAFGMLPVGASPTGMPSAQLPPVPLPTSAAMAHMPMPPAVPPPEGEGKEEEQGN